MKRLAREKYYYLSPRYFTSSRIREFAFSRISTRSTPLLGVKNGGEGLKISPRAIFHHRVEGEGGWIAELQFADEKLNGNGYKNNNKL